MEEINKPRARIFGELLGAPASHCAIKTVDLDFLDEEKTLATELVKEGLGWDAASPSLFIAEGLVMYLGPGKLKLLTDVSAVAAPGSVFVLNFMEATAEAVAQYGEAATANALSAEEAARVLTEHGWESFEISRYGEEKLSFGRFPEQFEPSVAFSFCVQKEGLIRPDW